MLYKYTLLIGAFLVAVGTAAQTDSKIKIGLEEIQSNHIELKAFASDIEHQVLGLKSENQLKGPELSAYYMPFGDHSGGDYSEFEISQSLDFPTLYAARNRLIQESQTGLELQFQSKRQAVLLSAQQHFLELINLNQRIRLEEERTQHAKAVLDQIQKSFEAEQVGILTLQKAKVLWMQERFKVDQLLEEKEGILTNLKHLNGGKDLQIELPSQMGTREKTSLETLWNAKLSKDPDLLLLDQNEKIALRQLEISQKNNLPGLTLGFNGQGIRGQYYSGIYGGLSIPVWSNKHQVKSAQANLTFQELNHHAGLNLEFGHYKKKHDHYLLLLNKFTAYETVLGSLESESLLYQAYELGQISFLEYYMELNFYREAVDTYMALELELNLLFWELIKHEL